MKRLRTFPALDGIRGLSVICVVFSHMPLVTNDRAYDLAWWINQSAHLNYVMLDLFFTLSGFFITRLLLAERAATGTISFTQFYIRRALRIFPIYYLSIFACYFVFHFGWADTASLITYTFNIYHPFNPAPHPLEQSWSLSVEEQFYLAWPLLMSLIPLRAAAWVTGRVVPVIAVVCGIVLGLTVGTHDPLLSGDIVYMSPLTRMLSLSLGGWMAVREFESRPLLGWRCLALLGSGLALLALDRLGRDSGIIMVQGIYWTIALVGYAMVSVAVIGTVVFDPGRLARSMRWLLSRRPLRGVGRISYGLYLYHLPVLFYFGLNDAAMRGGRAPIGRVALASGLTLAIGVVSYFVIERPLLSRRRGLGLGGQGAALEGTGGDAFRRVTFPHPERQPATEGPGQVASPHGDAKCTP